jgi:hypothetical protein
VPHQSSDPLVRLRQIVLDRTVPLGDVLRTAVDLADSTGAKALADWAMAELDGYPGLDVPEYRKVRAEIWEQIKVFGPMHRPFDVYSLPEEMREYFSDVVPLNSGVDALEQLIAESKAQGRQLQIQHYASDAYARVKNRTPGLPFTVMALYWSVSPAVAEGVLFGIRNQILKFVKELRAEVGADGQLPSAEQTDQAIRETIGTAYFTGSVNIFTGQTRTGDIVSNQPEHQYNFGGVKGNVAAGSQNFTQVYQDTFDVAKVREFADFIAQIAPTLELASDEQAELETAVLELRAVADDPAGDRGRMRKALDAVMAKLKSAASTVATNVAVGMGNQLGGQLDTTIMHHLPHL